MSATELSEIQREMIADLIRQGYVEGYHPRWVLTVPESPVPDAHADEEPAVDPEIAALAEHVSTTEEVDADNLFCAEPTCGAQLQWERDGMDCSMELAEEAFEEGWRVQQGQPWCAKH